MRLKRGLLAGIALCCMPLMTACSAKDTIGILVGNNSEDTKKEEVTVDLNAANIDDSVEKPQITSEMGDPVTYDLHATADVLTVEATVSEGTLSYQWYRNNVDSNGGGTAIDGATEATYTPPTTESGTIYYYVVVTNTVGDGVQLTASRTKCVTITEQEAAPEETGDTQEETAEETTEETTEEVASGSWQQTDGNWWYQNADGTYPTSCWQEIDGQWYVFDENGYIRTGWYQEGDKWYYFQENGAMAHDTDVDGYHLGSDGVMQ